MTNSASPADAAEYRSAQPMQDGLPPFVRVDITSGVAAVSGLARCSLGTAFGPDQACGVFARWSWDGAALSAEVDPLGFFSLFVYAKGGTIALSPSIPQLIALGADTTRDDRALGVFHRLGLFINDDTPFRYIRALPAGGRLRWRAGELSITGGDFVPAIQEISRDDAVDGLIELTRTSLREISATWPGEFVLPISGGRDSRHILLALDHIGRRPSACVTFQHRARGLSTESQSARAICESLGARHLVLGDPRPPAPDIFRAMMLTSFCSDEHVQMMALHDYLRGSPAATLDGIAGDILTNPDDDAEANFACAQKGDFAGIARRMIQGHRRVITRPGFGSGDDGDEETVAYLATTIARYADAADPYQAFWFWHRTRREISFVSTAILAGGAATFCPFLDRRFVEFGLSLPFSITRDQQLHNDAIRRGYSKHAHVPFIEGFSEPPGGGRGVVRHLCDLYAGARMILSLGPEHPLNEVSAFTFGTGHLWRRPGTVAQLHRLALESLDAIKARKLLAMDATLRERSSSVNVTDQFDGA